MRKAADMQVHPATKNRWPDLETLFGKNGACAGCWCMWFRLKRSVWDQQRGEENKKALKDLVTSGQTPGLIAYLNGKPVGWCSLGPRADFAVLSTSRILKPVDEKPVWSVVCFFVDRKHRRNGITRKLLDAAVSYAKDQGAEIVEGYPVEPRQDSMPDLYAYHGIASMFRKAGFREVARRSETRPMMRKATRAGNNKGRKK